ncbi:MAG: DUF11 domain-containing protein [Phycisphaerae bacterium]|nr:DUF11 domain-containing protein [Phycisphaerae bacterium]
MRTKVLLLCLTLLMFGLLVQGCSCSSWTKFWGGDPDQKCATHWKWKKGEPISPCAAAAMERTSQTFPVAVKGTAIKVEKMAPTEVRTNEPFDYQIKVTNMTNRQLDNVMVKDSIRGLLKINSSTPEVHEMTESQAIWSLGTLGPKASEVIMVSAVAESIGTVSSCAEVTYDSPICAKINVVEPKLRLTKFAATEAIMCDRIPLRYVITNTGDGYACGIEIKDAFEQGLMTSEGLSEALFSLESLGPGESREFSIMVDASKVGEYSSRAMAMVGNQTIESNVPITNVTQPVLAISGKGPQKQYLGRSLVYEFTVFNKGDGIAKDTIVEAMVPEEVQFDNATSGGVFTRSSPGKVTWNLGTLEPNTSKKIQMTIHSTQEGALITRTQANAYCADMVSESMKTMLSGISAILLEVVDVSDPIEVGQEETYIITVTNQGSSSDTNISVDCMFEDNMSYVSSTGPTQGVLEGSKLSFSPLKSLAPKATAAWRVKVKALGQGDMRFRVNMNSDQLTRIVEETEATKFFE